jgi:ATP-dependent RNA helicase DDX3X
MPTHFLDKRGKLSLSQIQYVCLDEADRMLDMGFEKDIRSIVQHPDMPKAGKRQTVMFSATFPKEIKKLAADFMQNFTYVKVGKAGSSTDTISHAIKYIPENQKKAQLLEELKARKTGELVVGKKFLCCM